MKKVDLHMHTTYSDGELSVNEIIVKARQCGVTELAITDHDTIINIKDYKTLAQMYGVQIIPGIELNVDYTNMHILGYNIVDFDLMESKMNYIKEKNISVCIETIKFLAMQGIRISFEDVMRECASKDIITKRHIARYLVKNGYASTNLEVYERLMGKGCKAYIPIEKLNYLDALRLITECGGIAVLAHPITIGKNVNFDELLPIMKENGLIGIESMTAQHTDSEKVFYRFIAKKFNLIETAGSDFHRDSDEVPIGMIVEDNFLDDFYVAVKK